MIIKYVQKTFVFVTISIAYIFCGRLINILTWTRWDREPTLYVGLGQEPFIIRNCTYKNCFITNKHNYFENILYFDVLTFNIVDLFENFTLEMPKKRSPNQSYVFISTEPSPVFTFFENYDSPITFNLSWTYKLSSDIVHPYLIVKNKRGEVIGPKKYMHWPHSVNEMEVIGSDIISKLRTKHIAAAWIASNCDAMEGKRLRVIKNIQNELSKYGQNLDIYGKCGNLECKKVVGEKYGLITNCAEKIQKYYYFYLAFENSFGEDYVSEKLLHALNNFAVPVVYGGANYTRFMPKGIYLNARWLGVRKLAKKMNDIIHDPKRYYDYFKWHGYYSFHNIDEDQQRDVVCGFCALLNNKTRREQFSMIRKSIDMFWNPSFDVSID